MKTFPVSFSSDETRFSLKFGSAGAPGGTVSGDYNDLTNKPSIEGVVLVGDKSFRDLGLDTITEADIDDIIFGGDTP